ncbi:uncharacterized protein FOMMEDRAFT_27210 [Fomitiporia mediterranea MF3/22]|uniref:uncharacterized protein n=1 Tax=Fomitiporia mediterranea (strain MF3/22) TaxID=694068 RepID=UPI0004408341|nr:uncharacterized protein FOMMEDRAFT_27210 [Fomitiporia mediterranea MF3/22]EJD04926.1 hypothetical protein FOMMEDRAFT_27210 [Fomitiporia mediterranea MF3/22]
MMNGVSGKLDGDSRQRVKPKLSIGVDGLRSAALRAITIDTTPSPAVETVVNNDRDGVEEERSSSPSSASSSPLEDALSIGSDSEYSDDINKNLQMLEKLRRNVHKNLRLRPLRSSAEGLDSSSPPRTEAVFDSTEHQHRSDSPALTDSPAPSPALSVYYTPTTEFRASPLSARFIGNYNDSDSTNTTPVSVARHHAPHLGTTPRPSSSTTTTPLSSPPLQGMDADSLFDRLAASKRPLLIDTRPLASYLSCRLQHSLNIAIPSLILRRRKKSAAGLPSLEALRTYITTDAGKRLWDDWISGNGAWTGDVVVYDEEMDEHNRDNLQALSWAMLSLLQPLIGNAAVHFLKGGIAAARAHPESHQYIIAGEQDEPAESRTDSRPSDGSSQHQGKGGLFQLDTQAAARSKTMPQVEPPSSSPGPLTSSSNHNMLCDLSPSPSPSTSSFPHNAKPRKCSIPNLRRIDTSSAERLIPKLTVRTVPLKSNTLAAPMSMSRHSSSSSLRSNSPSHLNLSSSKNGQSRSRSPPSRNSSIECLSTNVPPPDSLTPRTPNTPMGFPASPATARPDYDQPPSTEDPLPVFSISMILPNFLYLGPEPSCDEHVEELQSLGVKRILNVAIECDDDQGLRLREKFERYTRIPMRDIVEEENVARSVREVCDALDDARLHSAPTYVHCKAGKSRSVTAVIAYLIHANHWTLSRAYAFVTERRKGISPNIGFVSELMTFEEQELGGKSVGVVNPASAVGGGVGGEGGVHNHHPGLHSAIGLSMSKPSNFGYGAGVRGRAANLRESLPPLVASHPNSEMMMVVPGQLSAGGIAGGGPGGTGNMAMNAARVGDSGQEMEIKDASGRYRHARRAPVDENTLQPMRRVSKAGLESSIYSFADV